MAVIISVQSLKGGVGKTTTVISLASFYSQKGNKVLMLDLDPKATLTHSLIDSSITSFKEGIYNAVIYGQKLPIISLRENLHISPGAIRVSTLAQYDTDKVVAGLERLLSSVSGDYDVIMMDTSSFPSTVFHAAGMLADRIICPIKADYASVLALDQTVRLIGREKIVDILLVQHDTHEKHTVVMENELRGQYDLSVLGAVVRRNVALRECMAERKSIFEYRPDSAGAADYASVATELFTRLQESFKN